MNINNALRALLAVLILAFAGFVGWTLRDTTAQEGSEAPAFSVVTDQGKAITPTSFGGKVLVLNFWATWCRPCLQEIPSLNQFQQQFAGSGVVVVAVSIDKKEQNYRNFLKRIPVSFETARDPKADISGLFGTFQYPETYIIKDGRVMRKYPEGEDWTAPEIQRYVRTLL